MNNSVKSFMTVIAALAMVFVSCKKEEEEIVVPRSVTLERQELTLTIGTEQTISATVESENAADKSVSWESSDAAVVSVSAEGKLKALAEGSAVITVSTFNGCKDKCFVTVWDGLVHVTGVRINQPAADMIIGDHITLSATVLPDKASDKSVVWSSSDANVATVSDAGEVEAVSAGRAVITVTTVDGLFSDKCVVSVKYSPVSVSVSEAKALSCCSGSVTGAFYVPADAEGPIKKGVIYSTESDASLSGSVWVEDTQSEGTAIAAILSPLMPSTKYYVRTWVSVAGTVYLSTVSSFETFGVNTLVQTAFATEIGAKKATLNASVNLDGTVFAAKELGFKFRKAGDEWTRYPVESDNQGVIVLNKTDLVSGTTYEFCAYVSLDGRSYESEVKSFATQQITVTYTKGIKDVADTEVTIFGTVTIGTSEQVDSHVYVYYSNTLTTVEELKAAGSRQEIELGAGGAFSHRLTGLKAGTTYKYMMSVVVDGWEHDFGLASIPLSGYTIEVTTLDVQDVSFSKATLRGTAVRYTNENNPPSMSGRFVYGTVSDPEQLKASGTLVSAQYWGTDNIYTKVLSGLKSGTTYYYMAAVQCNGDLVYGQVESFSTEAVAEPVAVDLGLSVKWASFNVGATKMSQTGFYFQWGDQDVPEEYSWTEYSLCTGSAGTIFKYKASDGKTVLDSEDDIATNLLGDGWRMPTKEECAELGDDTKVTWEVVTVDGVTGTRIRSKTTDNYIFIPLSGVISGTSTSNTNFAYLWTSTVSSNGSYSYAWLLTASSSTGKPATGNQTSRKDGCPVRAVKP